MLPPFPEQDGTPLRTAGQQAEAVSRDQRGKPRGCGGGGGERQGQQPHGPESPTAAVMQALGSARAPMEAKRLRGPAAQGQAGTAPCHLPSCQRGLPQDPCCPAPGPRAAPVGGGGSLTYRPPRVCGTRTGPRMSLIAASPGTWQSRSPWAWAGWHRRMPRPTQHSQQMVKPHRALPPPAPRSESIMEQPYDLFPLQDKKVCLPAAITRPLS